MGRLNHQDSPIKMASKEILAKVLRLIELHKAGALGGEIMPEDALLGIVDKDKLPDVITLGMSLNYQRNSYKLWESVAKTYTDQNSKWIFDPDKVANSDPELLRRELLKYKVGLQPNKHTEIWHKNATSLAKSKGALALISNHNYSIKELSETMLMKDKKEFPYLSGPKIFNYWLYVMGDYCMVPWIDRQLISVAPDTHVIQASVRLGLVLPEQFNGSAKSVESIAQAWRSLLEGSGYDPIDVHTPLWLWSRSGFQLLDEK